MFEIIRIVISKIGRRELLELRDISKQINKLLQNLNIVMKYASINLFYDVDKEFNIFNAVFMKK